MTRPAPWQSLCIGLRLRAWSSVKWVGGYAKGFWTVPREMSVAQRVGWSVLKRGSCKPPCCFRQKFSLLIFNEQAWFILGGPLNADNGVIAPVCPFEYKVWIDKTSNASNKNAHWLLSSWLLPLLLSALKLYWETSGSKRKNSKSISYGSRRLISCKPQQLIKVVNITPFFL